METTAKLLPKTIFAMPIGPPFGGMTTYTEMLRESAVFRNGTAILFDTTPPPSSRFFRRLLHAFGKLRELITTVRSERPAAVYFMTSDFLGFYEKSLLALCCRGLGAKTVLHPVGSFIDFYGAARSRWLIRLLLRQLNAVIVVQRRVQSYIACLAPGTPVWLIPNPVDCRRLPKKTNGVATDGLIRILFIGALVKEKGVLDLVEVVRRHQTELRGTMLTIVGDGPLFAECGRRIEAHRLETCIELKGFVDDDTKACCLSKSHIFCLPSHTEGTPISVLEAMGSGLPIVATNVGGIPSIVQHGVHGWLAEPGDIAALGRFVIHLVRNASVRALMGENAARRVREEFDIQTVAGLFISRINALAGPPGEGATPPSVFAPATNRL